MLRIKKMRADSVIDHAAEELKKYLRMMMPEGGDVTISFEPGARDGFRLGLLEDFGIEISEIDPTFDDYVFVETEKDGGTLAGSNPRSVLFAVYRFLKLNGCRWLFPGPEGEIIPQKKIEKQSYHHLAGYRLRGHTLEGAPSLRQVLDYIDFHAKEELNSFGLYGVFSYQENYYNHRRSARFRPEEGFDPEQAETQWRALYEHEIKKRGLLLFSGEHGLIPDALGIKESDRADYKSGKKTVSEQIRPYLAQIQGKRALYRDDIYFTNVCFSKEGIIQKMAESALRQAKAKPYLDYLGITVADLSKNHCECEECKKKIPSDWYVILLNEIDRLLSENKMDTRILFSFYTDMIFAPKTETLRNPKRFLLQFCPIHRSYSSSLTKDSVIPEPIPFVHNDWKIPKSFEEAYALFRKWQEIFPGPYSMFEYHYWRAQYRDPGAMEIARRVYEDIQSYPIVGVCGCMQDGSDKSFFPNGFHSHIYAETLMHPDLDYEAEMTDFYRHQYGEGWEKVRDYLSGISSAFDYRYMLGEKSKKPEIAPHYCPEHAESLSKVKHLTGEMQKEISKHRKNPVRAQDRAWHALLRHTQWCEGLAEIMIEKCQGNDRIALERWQEFSEEFSQYDLELDGLWDYSPMVGSLSPIITKMPKEEY